MVVACSLDTSGEALRQAVAAAPDLVKPNRAEATWFAGRPVNNATAAIEVAHEMIHAGARGVAVSLGADGIIWERAGNSASAHFTAAGNRGTLLGRLWRRRSGRASQSHTRAG